MKENYVDFKKLDINPRITYAAKQCGLLSSEGILYGSSRHSHPSRRLSPSDHSSLVAAVAAIHCPARLSCFDVLQLQCKNSTTAAKTANCNNNGKLFSHIQDVTYEAAVVCCKTEYFDNHSSMSASHGKKTHVPSSNTKKLSGSIKKVNCKSKDRISSTRQPSSYSSSPVHESYLPIISSLPHSNSLLECQNSLKQIPLCLPHCSAPIELCPSPLLRCQTPFSCLKPPPCPAPSKPCPAPSSPCPAPSSPCPAPPSPCLAPSSPPCLAPPSPSLAPPSQCPAASSQCTTTSPQHTAPSHCTNPLPRHPSPSSQCIALSSQCTTPSPQCTGPVFRCPKLASDLHGLFAPGSLVEVCGESGSGKTQLALSLALNTVLPKEAGGLASKVAYLCTEGQFPSSRLQQMVAAVCRSGPAVEQHMAVADSIMVQHIPDLLSLSNSIRYQLPALLRQSRPPLALVLLDSVAAPFRAEASDWRWTERQTRLHNLGHTLRILATEHHCSVLVINQVTARYGLPDLYGQSDMDDVTPALGLAWSNLVTSRLMLHRTLPTVTTCRQPDAEEGRQTRTMQLLFCPWLPRRTIPFVVAAEGVQGVTAYNGPCHT